MTTCQTTRQTVPASLLWKTVSEDCNLACEYCYYSSYKGQPSSKIRKIDDILLQKVTREMMEQSRGFASFAWQGGEPLLAGLDFFQRVVRRLSRDKGAHYLRGMNNVSAEAGANINDAEEIDIIGSKEDSHPAKRMSRFLRMAFSIASRMVIITPKKNR